MESKNNGNSERLRPSAPKKIKSLTLFEDLLDNLDTENLHTRTNLEDQRQKGISLSDCGRGVLATEQKSWLSNDFIRIPDGDTMNEFIKKKLVSSLNPSGIDAQVETIYRIGYSSEMDRAKLQSFRIYSIAVQKKCGGDANIVTYGWYGASKNVIDGILSYGFGLPLNNGIYGHALYLSAVDHPIESLQSSTADEDGLRHMLICRVILGSVELVSPFSGQYNPSSQQFDSGVDNLLYPKKYIIWNAMMNTHILPEFVVSFRTSSYCGGCLKPPRAPTSDWISVDALIKGLSEFVPADTIKLVSKQYNYYIKQKIKRQEMVKRVRDILGDRLLIEMIKSHMKKVCFSYVIFCCSTVGLLNFKWMF
ncbi:hypothetical protein Pfo_003777 [Paulownia fortunei]|nr:hypothetical protein Pfo_003777 [Paulownia fortunei]